MGAKKKRLGGFTCDPTDCKVHLYEWSNHVDCLLPVLFLESAR